MALFAWRQVHGVGGIAWKYEENAITGQRRATLQTPCGYQPINYEWLSAGVREPVVVCRGFIRSV